MTESIGNVILDYTHYKGKDIYSDGEIENELLEIVQSENCESVLKNSNKWPILYHLSDIRQNLLEWYPFENSDVLEIGSGCGALTGILSEKAASVTCIDLSKKRSLINAYRNKERTNIKIIVGNFQDIPITEKYDYITLIGVWEYSGLYVEHDEPYLYMLKLIKDYLKPNGKLIVAIENKMGLKYLNGAREDHTGKLYSGMNDYIGEEKVRTFSKPEIEKMLVAVGFDDYCFYYPVPDYKIPECIYTDKFLPQVTELRYYRNNYDMPRLYNFYAATSYDQVCKDNMFPYFSNSFFFVCGEKESKINYIKYNRERKEEFRFSTSIEEKNNKKYVVKRPLNEKAQKRVQNLLHHEEVWKNMLPNLKYAKGVIVENDYVLEFIEGVDLQMYLYRWIHTPEKLISKVKEIERKFFIPEKKNVVEFHPSEEFEHVFGCICSINAKSLKYTNIDLSFANLKRTPDGEVYNFDYEWVFDFPIPYEFVLWRMYSQLYGKYGVYLRDKISRSDFLTELGISASEMNCYESMDKHFLTYVSGEKRKEEYLRNYRKSSMMQDIKFT